MIKVNEQTREIFLYEEIGPSWAGMSSADDFVEALSLFPGKDVSVRINSPGGSADEGISMYNAARRHTGKVTTHNDGVAASAASVVFMAGAERLVAKQSVVMIHNASALAWGGAEVMRKMAEILDVYNGNLVSIYKDITGLSESELAVMCDEETWMNAADAVSKKFATGIFSPGETVEAKIIPVGMFTKTPEAYLKPAARLQFVKNRPEISPRTKSAIARISVLTGRRFSVD